MVRIILWTFIIFHLCFYSTASSRLDHICSPPLSVSRAAVGLLHGAHRSCIRLCSHHIHDDSCPSLHSGAHPAYQDMEPHACMAARAVLGVGFSAYCSAPCIPLQTPRRCIGTAPLRALSHASRFRQRPECVEIDAWATVGGAGRNS